MKIVASDYDGTLRTQEYVDKKDIEMIRKFRKAGNMFGIVTGRSMESIKQEIKNNEIEFDFIVANNGGVIYDREFQKLQCLYMDFHKALDIISYIKEVDCASYVINDGYHRYKFSIDEQQVDHKYANMPDQNFREEEVLDNGKIAQLVISLNDSELADEIAHHINVHFKGYAVAYVNINCVDIVPAGVSKAEGLYFIENEYHLCHEDIYAIGDSFNDVPMIQEFHGCAVAHARTVIKEQAEAVYASVGACIADVMEG
ncbi:HAD-IIB family hydrolase [Amedibacillus sp. YH-ame10]